MIPKLMNIAGAASLLFSFIPKYLGFQPDLPKNDPVKIEFMLAQMEPGKIMDPMHDLVDKNTSIVPIESSDICVGAYPVVGDTAGDILAHACSQEGQITFQLDDVQEIALVIGHVEGNVFRPGVLVGDRTYSAVEQSALMVMQNWAAGQPLYVDTVVAGGVLSPVVHLDGRRENGYGDLVFALSNMTPQQAIVWEMASDRYGIRPGISQMILNAQTEGAYHPMPGTATTHVQGEQVFNGYTDTRGIVTIKEPQGRARLVDMLTVTPPPYAAQFIAGILPLVQQEGDSNVPVLLVEGQSALPYLGPDSDLYKTDTPDGGNGPTDTDKGPKGPYSPGPFGDHNRPGDGERPGPFEPTGPGSNR